MLLAGPEGQDISPASPSIGRLADEPPGDPAQIDPLGGEDAEMRAAVSALSDDDFRQTVTRDSGYQAPITLQLDFYMQALLIFLGKASIFLRAMNKPLPQPIKEWIW